MIDILKRNAQIWLMAVALLCAYLAGHYAWLEQLNGLDHLLLKDKAQTSVSEIKAK